MFEEIKEMALNIVLNAHNVTSDKDCDLHLMPCKINHDGPANVKEFFVPNVHKRDLQKSGRPFHPHNIFFD